MIRNAVVKEKGSDIEVSWSDWVENTKDDTELVDVKQTHGFDKWYERSKETDLARQAAAQSSENNEDVVKQPEQEEWTPPVNIVKTQHRSTAVDKLPCSLPTEGSVHSSVSFDFMTCLSVDCLELQELGSQYADLFEFLNSMRLSEVAENAKDLEFTGDIITENDEVLKDIGMDAIDRLRFRVLFKRELLKQTSPVAVSFPVEKVVAFFREKPNLAKYAAAVEENGIDGEMLLLADGDVFKQLKIPAAVVKFVKQKFSKLALETVQTQP